MSEEMKDPKPAEKPNYPELINTNAVLSYLREVYMALDNMSFQIRTTMNNIITTKVDVKEQEDAPGQV
jgi:hypothetical protein